MQIAAGGEHPVAQLRQQLWPRGEAVRLLGLVLLGLLIALTLALVVTIDEVGAESGFTVSSTDIALEPGETTDIVVSLSKTSTNPVAISLFVVDDGVVKLSTNQGPDSAYASMSYGTQLQFPAGQTSASFTVTALEVGASTITGVLYGDDQMASMEMPLLAVTVEPPPSSIFGVVVYPIINGDTDPYEAELAVRWSTSLDHASIASFKLEWKYGSKDFATQTPKILPPEQSLLPFGSSKSVASSRYRYVLVDLPAIDVQYGIRVTAVTDTGEEAPSETAFATPTLTPPKRTDALTNSGILPEFVKREVLDIHGDDYPWLREAWQHLLDRPTGILYWSFADNSQVATFCDPYSPSETELLKCWTESIWIGGGAHKSGANRYYVDKIVSTIVHELAHVYTLSNDVSSTPGPIGMANMYFQINTLLGGIDFCEPVELFADIWGIATLGDNAKKFPYSAYLYTCNNDDAWTENALAAVKSALSGQTPAWFNTRYGAPDPDLELLWADILNISDLAVRTGIIYQLRDSFGGYCDKQTTSAGAFADGPVRNPWQAGGCTPEAVASVSATATGNGSLTLSWEPPTNDGGSPITGFKVQWKSGSQSYDTTREIDVTQASTTTELIAGLTNGQAHTIRVFAYNQHGDGAATEMTATPTVNDTTAPTVLSAHIETTSLHLTWSEDLNASSLPPTSAFSVSVDGVARAVSSVSATEVSASGRVLALTLSSAVTPGQSVTVGYTKPTGASATPLRDASVNDVANFSSQTVKNVTTQVSITSTPSVNQTYVYRNGYGGQDTVEVTVMLSEPVKVIGKPGVVLKIGVEDRVARYVSGSGTDTLVFQYQLVEGELDADGVSVPAAPVLMDIGMVRFIANDALALGQIGLADQPNHKVDAVRPSLVSITATEGGNQVRLTFDKDLDEQSVPLPNWKSLKEDFGYKIVPEVRQDIYNPVGVMGVSISGKVVTLSLESTISASDGLMLRHYQQLYNGQPPLQGALGNRVWPVWEVPITFE